MSNLIRFSPLLLALFLQATPTVEPGFTSLFNGKDFSGWKLQTPEASWSIENGAMKANGRPSHAFYAGDFRKASFRNFELKVDVMTHDNSNGGIYVLTEVQESGWPKKGFEIQVNNTFKDPVKTGSLYHVADIFEAPAKDNEWFTEHIIVKGDTITVKVNDKQTVEWKQPADWSGGREGPGRAISGPGTIALQAHDANSVVYYRNIRIKPLD